MSTTNYPYETHIQVTFRDLDALGHVNNAVFFTYLETARIEYITKFLEHGLPERFDLLSIPIILVEATCSYQSQALFGEHLTVGVGVTRFGNKSFDLAYKIMGEDGRLIATGKTIQVMYNYDSNSAFPIPDVIKQSVYAFQAGWTPDR
ncbi:MAG: acyl-CoA thioesterase [Anaerolineales bacterium]|nr:acyl-CoA thioesterase [Anaerolineales bacterium]